MSIYAYIFTMALTTYLIRVVPITLLRKEITNRTFRSFLTYVPYVTLSVMTFPAIVEATQSPLAGIGALVVGIIVAWIGGNLFLVAGSCCAAVFLLELLI